MPIRHESPYGAPVYGDGTTPPTAVCASGSPVPASAATLTALKAITDLGDLTHGNRVFVDADGSHWYWHSTSTLTGDDLFVATPAAAPTAGRWLRCPGPIDLSMAIAYTTADAAALATLPTGSRFVVMGGYWEVTTGFTGGSSSAIGLSSSQTGHTTKGDILGGSGGNVTALLGTAGIKEATIGADIAAGVVLIPASTIRFDQVTSTFTAGAGYAHLFGLLVANAGA